MEALRKENSELKDAIKKLSVEKNRLEDQLYRAFQKCLNAKKRKIQELQLQLERFRDGEVPKKKKKVALCSESSNDENEADDVDNDSSTTDIDDNVEYVDRGPEVVALPDNAENVTSHSSTVCPASIEKISKQNLSERTASFDTSDDDDNSLIPMPRGMRKRQKGYGLAKEKDPNPKVSDSQGQGQEYDLDELAKDL